MTTAYLTAGLPVQDTSTAEASDTTAWITAGLPASELPHTGYHLYVAAGSLNDVDFTTPDATFAAGASSGSLAGYAFAASTTYSMILRAVSEDLETPDISNYVEFVTDGDGEWTGLRPDPVTTLTAKAMAGGVIRLAWYHRIYNGATPDDFEVNYGSTPSATGSSATVTYTGANKYTKDITLADGLTNYFSVVARTAGLDSTRSTTLGITADASAPDAPSITTETTWRTLE